MQWIFEHLPVLTNFFEMVAALAALAVSYLIYCQVKKDQADRRPPKDPD